MSTNKGFFEKMRRSLLGVDEIQIKEAQESVIQEEKQPKAERTTKNNLSKKSVLKSENPSTERFLSFEEASLAFTYGTGILKFVNPRLDEPAKSAKSCTLDEASQALEHGVGNTNTTGRKASGFRKFLTPEETIQALTYGTGITTWKAVTEGIVSRAKTSELESQPSRLPTARETPQTLEARLGLPSPEFFFR